jgi:copper transport protein
MGARAALAAAALALALLALLPGAAAHSNLASSDPRAGARLDATPSMVMLTMTEPVDPAGSRVTVTDTSGARVDLGDLRVEPGPRPVLHIHLRANLPGGAYTIAWEVLSGTDGHHTSGTVGFAVGAFTPPGSTAQSVNRLDAPSALSRSLAYAGFSLAFGGAAFLAWLRRAPHVERLARSAIAWGTALHLAGTLLLAQITVTETGIGWGQLGSSTVGRVLLARLLLGLGAWAMAMLAQARPTRTGPWAAVALLLGAGLGAARLGHGSSDGPATVALDLLHLVATSTWVGSLALLLVTLHRARRDGTPPAELRSLGIRYGTLALACVVVLWMTGAILALAILGREGLLHPGATLGSAYGVFLAGKMALAALMVAIAAVNRYVFLEAPSTAGLAGGLQKAARRASGGRVRPLSLQGNELRTAVAVEALLGAVVLVLAGFLTSVSPPAAAEAQAPVLAQQGDTYLVHLLVEPPARVGGSSALTFFIEEAATGKRLANNTCGNPALSCVSAEVSYAGLNGTEGHEAHLLADGSWSVHDLVWTRAGAAKVKVNIASADVFHDEVTFDVTVAA